MKQIITKEDSEQNNVEQNIMPINISNTDINDLVGKEEFPRDFFVKEDSNESKISNQSTEMLRNTYNNNKNFIHDDSIDNISNIKDTTLNEKIDRAGNMVFKNNESDPEINRYINDRFIPDNGTNYTEFSRNRRRKFPSFITNDDLENSDQNRNIDTSERSYLSEKERISKSNKLMNKLFSSELEKQEEFNKKSINKKVSGDFYDENLTIMNNEELNEINNIKDLSKKTSQILEKKESQSSIFKDVNSNDEDIDNNIKKLLDVVSKNNYLIDEIRDDLSDIGSDLHNVQSTRLNDNNYLIEMLNKLTKQKMKTIEDIDKFQKDRMDNFSNAGTHPHFPYFYNPYVGNLGAYSIYQNPNNCSASGCNNRNNCFKNYDFDNECRNSYINDEKKKIQNSNEIRKVEANTQTLKENLVSDDLAKKELDSITKEFRNLEKNQDDNNYRMDKVAEIIVSLDNKVRNIIEE